MSSIPESSKQIYEERISQQAQTNNNISELIHQATLDDKKYLPFGPVLMNLFSQQKNDEQKSVLIKNVDYAKKQFCESKCKGKESCLNVCDTYFNTAVNYGMQHFNKVYKYAYSRTVKEEQ